jgi:hypothetical protein
MNIRPIIVASTFVAMTTGSAFATLDQEHRQVRDDSRAIAAMPSPVAGKSALRVTCYNGAKSDSSDLYRGWFCVPAREGVSTQ